jgi:TolA-binding protein
MSLRAVATSALVPFMIGATAALVRADTVWVQSGKGNPIAISDVKVIGVQGESIAFTTSVGKQDVRALAQVPQIAMDDEPAFSLAEESFRAQQFPIAAENYLKALQATSKPWIKQRSAQKLVQSANSAGNFPLAVQGFIQLVQYKPTAATDNKPAVPANGTAIGQGIANLKEALQNGKLSTDQKTVLNTFLAELYTAKGDTTSAGTVTAQMARETGTNGPDPNSIKVAADARLTEARQAYAQRQYAKAAQILNSNGSVFQDPVQRGDALFLLAQSTSATATADAAQLKDAALAYMRVVGSCEALPGKPHVAESLMGVAITEEKLKNSKEAIAVYNQIVAEFPGTPLADKAKESVARLNASAPKG